jgi:hypothetical protein
MTLQQAIELRNKYFPIIGKAGDMGAEIIDVIIEPLGSDIFDKFRNMYVHLIQGGETVNTEKMVQSFKAESYQVTVVLDYDGGLTQLAFDSTIDAYSSLI